METTEINQKEAPKELVQPFSKSRRRLFRIIGAAVIAIGIAILFYPFVPYLNYKFFPPSSESALDSAQTSNQKGLLSYLPLVGDKLSASDEAQTGNRLIIPKIGVNSPIVEGPNDSALLKGAWRIPDTSTPDAGGNTVITGHRFRFLPPNNTTFYLLDKIGVGDKIKVVWNEKEYHYQVVETKIVNPDQAEIMASTEDTTITLYTCTPLFTTQQRLVVIGKLI